jgi:hypothetical protein
VRHAASTITLALTILLLAACGQPAPSGGSTSSAASPTTTATSAPPSPTALPPSAWASYTTTDGTLTFDYPSGWSIKDPAGTVPAGGGVLLTIANPQGKQLATLRTNVVTGSECTQKYPYSVLESEPLPALSQAGVTPRYTFESRTDISATDPAKLNVMAYGITSAPEPTGTEACPIFHFFTWPPSGASFGGAYNPFDTTGATKPTADTPEVYMQTQEYKDIKRMIVSLRPVL